jgi:hypothetical protein
MNQTPTKRIDKLDDDWVVKYKDYRSVCHAKYLEDKLECVRLILNEMLEEDGND